MSSAAVSVRSSVATPRAARASAGRTSRAASAIRSLRPNTLRVPAAARSVGVQQTRAASRSVVASATLDDAAVGELNTKFGIPGSVSVVAGDKGLPKVVLTHECGSSAEVHLFGGCVTSWKQISGDEVLYCRPDAVFDGSKPISGGIPHCFPQFGPGEMQQHGFARNLPWEISSTSADLQPDEKDPEVELVLTDNEYTRAMWDFPFKMVYSVSLHGEELKTELRVINTGDKEFTFTAAVHSYFEVAGIKNAKVKGLKGLSYLDKVPDPNNPATKKQEDELVTFGGPVDSVFLEAPEEVELDVGTGAAISITSTGWKDCVVWSPWDVMPDCFDSFCCVENALVSTPAAVPAGESWASSTVMKVIDL